jgi:predicted RNA-binding Zn ribbon-like protein
MVVPQQDFPLGRSVREIACRAADLVNALLPERMFWNREIPGEGESSNPPSEGSRSRGQGSHQENRETGNQESPGHENGWAGSGTSTESPSVARVSEVLRAYGEPEPIELSDRDVAEMREAAMKLREIFAAGEVDRAAERLNALLAAYAHQPRLTTHGATFAWHLHVDSSDDAPWGEWLVTSSCLALAVLLADRQAPPGGICAANSCGKSFVDTGRGSPRRYCSPRCATRERVAAHRGRGA